jgi:hypothetical protein
MIQALRNRYKIFKIAFHETQTLQWCMCFKSGLTSVHNLEGLCCPPPSVTDENVEKVQFICEDIWHMTNDV